MVDISTRYDTSLRRRDIKLILKQRGVSCLYAIAFYKVERRNFFMGKKPNAANITHALAQLGGGSKKEGGDGMMKGLENIFATGVKLGTQKALEGNLKTSEEIENKKNIQKVSQESNNKKK